MLNIPTKLNHLITKVDDLDVNKWKTVPVDLKNLNDVVKNEVVKNKNFSSAKSEANKLDKKNSDATTFNHINQYNPDKQNVEKKN